MKVYDSFGPNPRALRMFLREKGIELTKIDVDLLGAENRRAPYTERNPGGQVPALELDDGRVLGETVAIFEYLEEKHPTPPLVGRTPEERAETRQWQRRVASAEPAKPLCHDRADLRGGCRADLRDR